MKIQHQIKHHINIQTSETEMLEQGLNLAHQGYYSQGIAVISLMALFGGYHITKLFYYLKEAGVKEDEIN